MRSKTEPETTAPPRRKRKSFMLRGLITVLPAVLTLFILVIVVQFVNRYVTQPVNSTLYWSLEGTAPGWKVLAAMDVDPYDVDFLDLDLLPGELQDAARRDGVVSAEFQDDLADWRRDGEGFLRNPRKLGIDTSELRDAVEAEVHPLIGVVLSFVLVLTIGYLCSGFVGRRLVASVDRTLQSIPIVRSVHPYTKQFVEFFLSESKLQFENVVAVEFFNDGVWSIGFVTGPGLKSIRATTGEPMVSVFIPSSPMPMTGFTVFVPKARVVALPISVDDAARTVVTGGVLIPPAETVEELTDNARAALEATAEPDTDNDGGAHPGASDRDVSRRGA